MIIVFSEMKVQAANSSFETKLKLVDFGFVAVTFQRIVREIRGNIIISDGMSHFLINLLLLL